MEHRSSHENLTPICQPLGNRHPGGLVELIREPLGDDPELGVCWDGVLELEARPPDRGQVVGVSVVVTVRAVDGHAWEILGPGGEHVHIYLGDPTPDDASLGCEYLIMRL